MDAVGEVVEHHFWTDRDRGRGCELYLKCSSTTT
jgi:hypothetical protein